MLLLFLFLIFSSDRVVAADQIGETPLEDISLLKQASPEETLEMLNSLVELQQNLRKQLTLTRQKIKSSTSDAEKKDWRKSWPAWTESFQIPPRILSGSVPGWNLIFLLRKKSESFSWKDEIVILVEPAIRLPTRADGRRCTRSFHDHI
jgi:hypothetical protein